MAAAPTPTTPAPGQEIEVEIVDVRKIPPSDPRRLGQWDALITVRWDNRVDMLRVPWEALDKPEELAKYIKAHIQEIKRHLGKRIKVKL